MAQKRKNTLSVAARGAILLAVIGIPLLFAAAVFSTNLIMTAIPYFIIVVLIVASAIYCGMTATLLYDFFESEPPMYRWLPCIGEFSLMDGKYLKFGIIFYIIALVFFGISVIPYSVLRVFGEGVLLDMPVYAMVVALIFIVAVQVTKGIGLMGCIKVVNSEWEEKMHTSLGFIKSFSWLGFVPFVRVIAVYALNKPLSTLVTFNGVTVSDSDDVVLEEDDA